MKTIATAILFLTITFTGYSQKETYPLSRGKKINEKGAFPASELKGKMQGHDPLEAKVIAEVVTCCMKKGCWMEVKTGDNETMRVTFKDYGFFVPFDSPGRTVVMEGIAYYDTVSVDMLRHYAEDAGKTEDEIKAITEPEYELAFEATGLILK